MAIGRGGLRRVNRALVLALGLLVFSLLAMGFATKAALAQDWKFESNLSQRMGYNSNLLLRPDHEISTFSSQTTPELKLSRAGPTSDIALTGRFPFNEYFGHSELNEANQFATLNSSKALSERSQLAFDARFAHDTTTESDDEATGEFLDKQIRFFRWNVTPSWQYLLSPIDRVRLSANYLQTTYDSNEKTDFRDYGPSATYSHDLSELAAVFATIDYSRFEPDEEVESSEDTYGGLLGYSYHPTERFSLTAAAGLNYNVNHEEGSKDQSDIGYRFQFNMDYQINDQTKATVALSRDTEPSGEGAARTRNRGSVGVSYKMTEMTTFSLDGSYIDDQQTQSNSSVSRRIQVRPGVQWTITDDLSLQAYYQFRYKTFESSGSAIDNGAFITLRYALPDLNWSGF
jgi:hypothetical protein